MNNPQPTLSTLLTTSDGSHTLYSPRTGEHYHSTHGAKQESSHIFIEAGLKAFASNCERRPITVFEVGFGTGLNAFLTLQLSLSENLPIHYLTIEKHPITTELAGQLNYCSNNQELQPLFNQLHDLPWDKSLAPITNLFHFAKTWGDFSEYQFATKIDVVFFDAFSPENEPSLWTLPLFKKLFDSMNQGGILTTYCAKGAVRRMLIEAGFIVERLAGPPGKREILRANKTTATAV